MKLEKIKINKILNSRGEETIEVQVNDGVASAPSGASRGKNEVIAYPRNNIDLAIERFQFLVSLFKGKEVFGFEDFYWIEEEIKKIGGIELFGGNTILAFELAILDALSKKNKIPKFLILNEKVKEIKVRPLGNVIGGGIHSNWRGPDFQEFLITNDSGSVEKSIFLNAYFHRKVKELLLETDGGFLGSKNDEGAWVPSMGNKDILNLLLEAKSIVEVETGANFKLGLDIAASQLYRNGKYYYIKARKILEREEQIDFVIKLSKEYDLFYIEDPLYEEDFEGFKEINQKTKSIIVGDDLTVTNVERIKKAYEEKAVGGVIIKPNQIGYLTKVKEAIDFCKKHNLLYIISHRSGETLDNSIAHMAVAWEAPLIKTGIVGGERIAKLNELIRIEKYLKNV